MAAALVRTTVEDNGHGSHDQPATAGKRPWTNSAGGDG
jgi:hypothetical protein